MKTNNIFACEICEKETRIAGGWHLDGNLDFCSNKCVSKYIEVDMQEIFGIIKNQEKRITKLERFTKVK